MNTFLLFTQHFDRDPGQDYGRLSINSFTKGTTHIWLATSSYATKQYAESFHERGGLLPPQYRVKQLTNYTVRTKPLNLSHHKGVKGNFYQIFPFSVQTDKGGQRSDFGIHLDANVEGSLGCIVMNAKRFQQFEQAMTKLRSVGIAEIPLFVQYS
jgi:hypothetical protein